MLAIHGTNMNALKLANGGFGDDYWFTPIASANDIILVMPQAVSKFEG